MTVTNLTQYETDSYQSLLDMTLTLAEELSAENRRLAAFLEYSDAQLERAAERIRELEYDLARYGIGGAR